MKRPSRGTASKVVDKLVKRAGLHRLEYLKTGHPDTFFRDGIRREIKAYLDRLTAEQRQELEWMTENNQPWEILQEVAPRGPILRIRNLQTYDLYREYRRISCDWTQRYFPIGIVLEQKNVPFGSRGYTHKLLKVLCITCGNTSWRDLSYLKQIGVSNVRCNKCARRGGRNGRAKINEEIAQQIRTEKAKGLSNTTVAKAHGISPSMVQFIKEKRSWQCPLGL